MSKSHEEQNSTYRGIPDSLAHAMRALLLALPHVNEEKIDLVFRILEDRGDEVAIHVGEEDKLLSMKDLTQELRKSRHTIWRLFKRNPELQEKLLSGYRDGNPQYSLAQVRKFKAGRLN